MQTKGVVLTLSIQALILNFQNYVYVLYYCFGLTLIITLTIHYQKIFCFGGFLCSDIKYDKYLSYTLTYGSHKTIT